MINKHIKELIEAREFISVATSDLNSRPNAAPKFLLKVEANHIYLVDYIIGKTFQNIKVNPRISLSFIDNSSLVGYQLNGTVEILDEGPEYKAALKDVALKEVSLSTARIIEGVIKGQPHKAYEVASSNQFVILKIKIEETVQMQPGGTLHREKI